MTKSKWDVEINSAGAGCGSNSDYTVTWSVTWSVAREPMQGSMRQFLNTHGLHLHPGLRSLNSTAVM